MSDADVNRGLGPFFWSGLFVLSGVSWFTTLYAVLPGYGYVMAQLFYSSSFAALAGGMLAGALAFVLMDLLLPALSLGVAIAALRSSEGGYLFLSGMAGRVLGALCILHSCCLVAVVGVVLYLKFVVQFGGTWPWFTFVACLLGWSSALVCCHYLFAASRRWGG